MGSAQPRRAALPPARPWLRQAAAQAGVLWAGQPAGAQDAASVLPRRAGHPRTGWGGRAQHGSGISIRCPLCRAAPCLLPVPWHPSAMGAGTQEPGQGRWLVWAWTLPAALGGNPSTPWGVLESPGAVQGHWRAPGKGKPQTRDGYLRKTAAWPGHRGSGWQLGRERLLAERSHNLASVSNLAPGKPLCGTEIPCGATCTFSKEPQPGWRVVGEAQGDGAGCAGTEL